MSETQNPGQVKAMIPDLPTGPIPEKGECIFFKVGKKESRRNAKEMKFKGHGFGIFLGHVPPFMPDPSPDQLLRIMGTIGFLTFDDVAEFLGDELAAKCVKHYEDKYYGKEAQENAPEVPHSPIIENEASKLLDANGLKLQTAPSPEKSNEPTA